MAQHTKKQRLCAVLLCAALLASPAGAAAADRGVLACPFASAAVAHSHNGDCYDAAGALVCPLPEIPAHVHTDACYAEDRRLVCSLEETPGHRHGEGCYTAVRGELLCEDAGEEHSHTDACYAWAQTVSCPIPEGEGAHSHGEGCFESERVLKCALAELEEHVHGPTCFAVPEGGEPEAEEKGDPTADVESREDWERMFRDLDRSGSWNETLLAVAQSQLGYRESSRNFDRDSEWILGGYTRYGAWYGRPYSPWCAMFLSFCLHYAGIPEEAVPRECGVRRWIEELTMRGLFVPAEGCEPRPGDLIFFDEEQDGLSDHVGIVESVYEDEAGVKRVVTIEGNRSTAVERYSYRLTNPTILGYAVIPDKPVEAASEPEENHAEPEENHAEPVQDAAEPEEEAEEARWLIRKTPLAPKKTGGLVRKTPFRPERSASPGWKKSPKP